MPGSDPHPAPPRAGFDRASRESAIRYPLQLPDSALRRLPKVWLGRLLCALLPQRAAQLLVAGDPMDFGFLDRLLVAGLVARAAARQNFSSLDGIQQRFWAGRGGALFNTVGDVADRFDKWFLQRHARIVEELAGQIGDGSGWQGLYELGSGNGLALDYLAQRFPGLPALTGVDLNDTATRANSARWPGGRLHFVTAEAGAWVAAQAAPQQIWFSNAGVLEYLPQARLSTLLSHIAQRGAPALFALVEPIAPDHDLALEPESRIKAGEFSYSHNHPELFKQAGWQLLHCEELHHESSRWLLLLARVEAGKIPPPPALLG